MDVLYHQTCAVCTLWVLAFVYILTTVSVLHIHVQKDCMHVAKAAQAELKITLTDYYYSNLCTNTIMRPVIRPVTNMTGMNSTTAKGGFLCQMRKWHHLQIFKANFNHRSQFVYWVSNIKKFTCKIQAMYIWCQEFGSRSKCYQTNFFQEILG